MPVTLKGQDRINTRSPYYIDCVPSSGETITSAAVVVDINTGSRIAGGGETTHKTYTLAKTDTLGGNIVLNIAPLIYDWHEFDLPELYDISASAFSSTKEILEVNVDKTVVDTGGSTNTVTEYVATPGWLKHSEGVNFLPTTSPTGTYGDGDWGTAPAKTSNRTIPYTENVYRQISDNGYGIFGIHLCEWDEDNDTLISRCRIIWGDNPLNDIPDASDVLHYIDSADDSSRRGATKNGRMYFAMGNINLGADWASGYEYMTVEHAIGGVDNGAILSGTHEWDSVDDNPRIRYEIICEPKYNVVDCFFINKWGAWETFSFVKRSDEEFNVEFAEYNTTIGEVVSSAFTYDTQEHTRDSYNHVGRKSISVNTGFVSETFGTLLPEILMSPKIYLVNDSVLYPVLCDTKSVTLKKSVNDKLINYTLKFRYATPENQLTV